jgi:hypothetical protein
LSATGKTESVSRQLRQLELIDHRAAFLSP